MSEHATLFRELRNAVRAGTMQPFAAEERCRKAGFDPVKPSSVLLDGELIELPKMSDNATWSPALAILFYAWRDLTVLDNQWRRFELWGRDLWLDDQAETQPVPLAEAEDQFKSDVIAGLVRIFGTKLQASAKLISLNNLVGFALEGRNLDCTPGGPFERFDGLFVLRHEVVPFWDWQRQATENHRTTIVQTKVSEVAPKPGRPMKHDWAGAAAFAAWYIAENDYPSTQSELVSAVADWFTGERKQPDKREIERFVEIIFERRINRAKA